MWVLFGLGIFALFGLGWFINGFVRDKDKLRDKMDEAYHESLKQNREADRMLDDPDYKRRVFEEDNKG